MRNNDESAPERGHGATTDDISDFLFGEEAKTAQPPPKAAPVQPKVATSETVRLCALPWPSSTPDDDALFRLLIYSHHPAPELQVALARVQSELTPTEQRALKGELFEPWRSVFEAAAVMRLRLAASLSTVPQKLEGTNLQALEETLARVDAMLGQLKTAPEHVQTDGATLRAVLARDAVPLSQLAVQISRAKASVSRVPSAAKPAEETRPQRRRKFLPVLFLCSMILGVSFHGWRYAKPRAVFAQMSVGQVVAVDPKSRVTIVHAPGASPSAVKTLSQEANAQGQMLHAMGDGSFVLLPKPEEVSP